MVEVDRVHHFSRRNELTNVYVKGCGSLKGPWADIVEEQAA